MHLYFITVLTKIIAIVFVFENFIVFVIVFKYYGKYLHLYFITVLTKIIAIVFVFENFIVFVIVFKYYAMYLDPSLVCMHAYNHACMFIYIYKSSQI